jgi:hypothetical protein
LSFLLTFSMNVLTSWAFLSLMALVFSVGLGSRPIVPRRLGQAKSFAGLAVPSGRSEAESYGPCGRCDRLQTGAYQQSSNGVTVCLPAGGDP